MKLTILMYTLTSEANLNPFIGIAQNLQRFGHRIVFAIEESHKEIVINYGFEAIAISSNQSVQYKESEKEADQYLENFIFELTDSSFSPIERMRKRTDVFATYLLPYNRNNDPIIKEIINQINPNIIIVNTYICAIPSIINCERPWISVAMSNPLYFIDDIRTPPSESGLSQNDQKKWIHFRDERLKAIEKYRQMNLQWLCNYGISLPMNSYFYHSKVRNIYHFPKELDYTDLRPLPSEWTQFDAFVRMENGEFVIPKKLSDKTGKLIYISMGTFLSANIEIMKHFIDILAESPHRFIVSKGMFGDRYELPDNMWGEPMLPQTKVLPLVDMIIFHGGNNTLIEAFYFGKPMIVMPFCGDNYDNAQRVHEKGFGIRMDPNIFTKQELNNAIEKILNDEELTMKMKEISKRIQNEAESDKFSKFIESFVIDPRHGKGC